MTPSLFACVPMNRGRLENDTGQRGFLCPMTRQRHQMIRLWKQKPAPSLVVSDSRYSGAVTDEADSSRTPSGPEHQQVRLPILRELIESGWDQGQIQWKPEWRVPQSPHDAAKREGGKSFASWPVDMAIFDDTQHVGDWEHILVICEFKTTDSHGRHLPARDLFGS